MPQIVDQPYWAGRITGLGVGAAHDGAIPTFESLSAALQIALAPETQSRATALAEAMRGDGAVVAAKYLIETVSRRA